MSIQIKYAYRRHNTWTYRRDLPPTPEGHPGVLPKTIPEDLRCQARQKAGGRAQHQVHRHSTGGREPMLLRMIPLVRAGRLVLLCLDITGLGSWGSAQLLNWLPGI